MNEFTNPDPYVNKTEDFVCRGCNKTFQINTSYDKNGFPVSFQPKYCNECNMKPKITGAIGSTGTVSIESAKIPQNSIEGLQESLTNLSLNIKHGSEKLNDLEKDFSSHKDTVEDKLYLVHNRINNVRVQVGENKAAQTNFNDDQIGINLAHLTLIKEIHKTMIIGFCVFIVFSLATWGYLLYNLLNH